MDEQELNELRNVIRELAVNVAVLTQRINDLDIPKPPCEYLLDLKSDIKECKDNTNDTKKDIKMYLIKAVLNVIILSIASLVWLGFLSKISAANEVKKDEPKRYVSELREESVAAGKSDQRIKTKGAIKSP